MNHRRHCLISWFHSAYSYVQIFRNLKVPKTRAAKFCTVPRNILESPVCNLFHVILLAPRISRLLLDCYKICLECFLILRAPCYLLPVDNPLFQYRCHTQASSLYAAVPFSTFSFLILFIHLRCVTFVVEESSISELCVGQTCVISSFRRNVNEICALLRCYTA
jgi:hypothetical protein